MYKRQNVLRIIPDTLKQSELNVNIDEIKMTMMCNDHEWGSSRMGLCKKFCYEGVCFHKMISVCQK